MSITRAELLKTYDGPCTLAFANGERLDLPAGRWWTAAFGVVVDCVKGGCVTTSSAVWKLAPLPRFMKGGAT